MNLIFLDIDGVLNSTDSVVASLGPTLETSAALRELASDFDPKDPVLGYGITHGMKHVDPLSVALLNKLLKETNAGIVLSSTHRMYFVEDRGNFGTARHLQLLRKYLTVMGVNVPEFFSITKVMNDIRGKEVEAWINGADSDVQYVILDDDRDFMGYQPLVKVDGKYGFTFDDYVEASKHLGNPQSGIILA